MLDQPADAGKASQRPPRADEVAIDIGAVAGNDVAEVLLVSERESGEVDERVALGRLGPVDDPGDLVTGDEDMVDLQVTVDEHRYPRSERSLGQPAAACDHVGRKHTIGEEPLALGGEPRCQRVDAPAGPWRQRRVVQCPRAAPAAAHAVGDAVDGSPRWPSAIPGTAASASTGGFRHRTFGVGTGAIAIASTSTSVRA